MSFRQIGLGSEARTTFSSSTNNARVVTVIKNAVVSAVSSEVLPIAGTTWYTVAFTPIETGVYDVIVDNVMVGTFEVVSRSLFTILSNVEDQALGNWEWNKETKVMILYRQDGSVLGTYLCDDTLEAAYSRVSLSS